MMQCVGVPNNEACFENFDGRNCPVVPPLGCGPGPLC